MDGETFEIHPETEFAASSIRITSYNVCYTKLLRALRSPPAGLIMEAAFTNIPAMGRHHYPLVNFLLGWLVEAEFDNLAKIRDVITSYSIHYTKLYDCSHW